MAEGLFPHLKWDQLLAATQETLYMTALSGVATFVLGIALGLALFLTARGGLFHNHHFDRAADPIYQSDGWHHSRR